MQAIKQTYSDYRQAYARYARERYPALPEHLRTVPKHSDKTANGLTAMVINFLKWEQWQAERINCTGRPIRSKGRMIYIPTSGTKGTADISATIKDYSGVGRAVKIEVKIGRDKQSEAQKQYQKVIEQSGGLYWIVRTWDDFIKQYKQIRYESNKL